MVEVIKIMATSFQSSHARSATLSASDHAIGHHQPTPLPETLGHSQASLDQSLLGSQLLSPGSWYTQDFVCFLQESVSPVLWKFCNQIPLDFKIKFPGRSQSLCWIPMLGNLLWALELLQQCENFFGIIVLQFLGHRAWWLYGGANGNLLLEKLCHMLRLPRLL